jgi:hypothetical protein
MKAVIALLALILVPGTSSARTNWWGTITLTSAASACVADNHNVGETFAAAFLPSSIDNNGTTSSISMNLTHNAYSATVNARFSSTSKSYNAVGINSAGGHFTYTGSASNFRFNPSSITISTPIITMSGRFTNFFGDAGCTITFDGAFVLRR